MRKKSLAILIGGRSSEHKISLISGKSIINALDKRKYDIHIIGIGMDGKWTILPSEGYLEYSDDPSKIKLAENGITVELLHTETKTVLRKANNETIAIDVVFPALHGQYGEDGTVQAILKSANVAFVGVDVMASAVGMDKDVAKRLWRDAGIPIAQFTVLTQQNRNNYQFTQFAKEFGLPIFVKPANAGSSVGVHKVTNEEEYNKAVEDALRFDRKILVEEGISGVEVECAILGNASPKASVLGAILPTVDFYSYDAKYISSTGAKTEIPAKIDDKTSALIQAAAIQAFQCIGAEGLSRVDFFVRKDNSFVINEINTLPGFTSISMYPKLWEASGLAYSDLLDQLIALGIERHNEFNRLEII